MVRCIGGVKFSMVATVLPQLPSDGTAGTGAGVYERYQDEDSGEILTRFVPDTTPGATIPAAQYDIECYARGYADLGFRSSANREIYLKGDYGVFEAVEFSYPGRFNQINRQSFITNIRDPRTGQILWNEEETGKPTVFQVQSATPLFDPFGNLREWSSVLLRAEVQ